jgi:RNA polymerase sigma-70 factor (ECF subfamily)
MPPKRVGRLLEAELVDRALVERARDGDAEAYEALVRAVARRLFLIAYRIVRDTDAAEDAVQQTLVTIWKELPRLRDPGSFDSWTHRIVTRAAVRESKRSRRGQEITEIQASDPTTADSSAAVEARDEIDRAFEGLSPEHRAVVVLRYYADLPIKEIAYAMGIPAGTVASRLHRAMKDMRAAMGEDESQGPSTSTDEIDRVLAGESQR